MILAPIFRLTNRRVLNSIKQIRSSRPTVKIGKEKFEIAIDVRQYKRDEIRVKALPEYVSVEGKQEKKTSQGRVIRQFVRRFRLPDGCSPENMESQLSPDGVLTIIAKRRSPDADVPTEKLIPITLVDKERNDEVPVKGDICDNMTKKPVDEKKP